MWLYFLPEYCSEWQDVLIVCFCLVCVLSVFSIAVFLAPLWSRAHFCFVSLNIALIVALTEVKPVLISFVYIVGDTGREREGERARWKGKEAAIVIVLFGSSQAPLVWEEEKDVLCFVYDRVAKAATGNLWACRQAFSGCSAASQPFRSSLLRSTTRCCRKRTSHAATIHNLLPWFSVTSDKKQQIRQINVSLNVVTEQGGNSGDSKRGLKQSNELCVIFISSLNGGDGPW